MNPLTPRERDCLKWAAHGSSNTGIAAQLGVTPRTAKFHIENAMKKVGAKTRAEAVAIALTRDFIQL
ncbi:MAG: helix-turn-helix transcriptional regulator [Rhodobiaceae bacterium]|nr:helix-turn-helix transcriptional regulator [Rhodobiaceae bacterium]